MQQTCYKSYCGGTLVRLRGKHGATSCTTCHHYDNRNVKNKFLKAGELLLCNFSRASQQDIQDRQNAAEEALFARRMAQDKSAAHNKQIKQAFSVKKLHNEKFKKKMSLFCEVLLEESRGGEDKLLVLQEIRNIPMTYSNVMRILNSGLANTLKSMKDEASREIVMNLKKFVTEAQLILSEENVFKLIQDTNNPENKEKRESVNQLTAAKKIMLSNKAILERFATERTMLHKNLMTNSAIHEEAAQVALDEKCRRNDTIQVNATQWLKAVKRD